MVSLSSRKLLCNNFFHNKILFALFWAGKRKSFLEKLPDGKITN